MEEERLAIHEDPEVLGQRAKRGDRDSFNRLVYLFQKKVFFLAMAILRHQEEALEVVQETFLKAYLHLNSYQEGKNFEAWLMRIAKNTAIDRYRKMRAEGQWLKDKDQAPSKRGTLNSLSDNQPHGELRPLIELCIAQLAEKQRLVFLLRYLQGFSFEEIAQLLGVTIGTVKSLHFKAFRRLKSLIEKNLEGKSRP